MVTPGSSKAPLMLSGAKRVYDVIVLGQSLSGAATAALLAKRGLRVLIATLGPAVVSRESGGWQLPAAHPIVPPLRQLSGASAALDELGLGQDLQRLASPATGALQMLGERLRLSLPADPNRRRAELRRELSPEDALSVEGCLDSLEQLGRPWDSFLVAPPPYPARGFFERRRLQKLLPAPPSLPSGLTGAALAALAPFAAALTGESAPEAQAREASAMLRAPLRLWGGAAALADLCRKKAQEAGADLSHDEPSHLLIERKGVVLQIGGGEVRASCVVIACEGEQLAPCCNASGRTERKLAEEAVLPVARKVALAHFVVHADGLPLALEEAALLLVDASAPLVVTSLPARRVRGEANGERLLTVAQVVPIGETGDAAAAKLLESVRSALEPVLPFFERHILHQSADLHALHKILAPSPEGEPVGLRPDSDTHPRALFASNAVYPGFGLEGQLVAARTCANAAMELSGRKQVAAV